MPVPKVSILDRVHCIAIKYITVYGKDISSVNPSKCKSKKTIIHNNFLSEVSHTITIQNFDRQNWINFSYLERSIFFFCQAEQVLIFLGI